MSSRYIELDVYSIISIYYLIIKHLHSFILAMDSWLIHSSPSTNPPAPETSSLAIDGALVYLRLDRRIRGVVYIIVNHTANLRRGSYISII